MKTKEKYKLDQELIDILPSIVVLVPIFLALIVFSDKFIELFVWSAISLILFFCLFVAVFFFLVTSLIGALVNLSFGTFAITVGAFVLLNLTLVLLKYEIHSKITSLLLNLFYKESSNSSSVNKVSLPFSRKLLKLSYILFSSKTQKEVFELIVADWDEEYFDALFKQEIWKARWINVRYAYAFLAAMWLKSPIGDLIQFVIKIAKQ